MTLYFEIIGNTEWDPTAIVTGSDRPPLELLSIEIDDTTDTDALVAEHEPAFVDKKPYRISICEHHHDEGRPQDCVRTPIKEVR